MNFVEKTITDSNIWFKSTCRVKMTIFSKEKRPTMCITITATSREFQLFIDRSQLYCGHFYQFFKWTLLRKLQSIIQLKKIETTNSILTVKQLIHSWKPLLLYIVKDYFSPFVSVLYFHFQQYHWFFTWTLLKKLKSTRQHHLYGMNSIFEP